MNWIFRSETPSFIWYLWLEDSQLTYFIMISVDIKHKRNKFLKWNKLDNPFLTRNKYQVRIRYWWWWICYLFWLFESWTRSKNPGKIDNLWNPSFCLGMLWDEKIWIFYIGLLNCFHCLKVTGFCKPSKTMRKVNFEIGIFDHVIIILLYWKENIEIEIVIIMADVQLQNCLMLCLRVL